MDLISDASRDGIAIVRATGRLNMAAAPQLLAHAAQVTARYPTHLRAADQINGSM